VNRIKLYLDADVHPRIALVLRERGFDALSAQEIERKEISDEEQLEFAISQDKAILTHNTGHFAKLHKDCMDAGKEHNGIKERYQLSLFRHLLN
jgi:uncharacterized protein with PIN domain